MSLKLLAFICEWIDPWHGSVDEDDLWDWENNSTIDLLNEKMRMLRYWSLRFPKKPPAQRPNLSGLIDSNVATLRMQRKHEEALELALESSSKIRLGFDLVLLQHCVCSTEAIGIKPLNLQELRESDVNDPRVKALSVILGHEADAEDIEVSLVLEKESPCGDGSMMLRSIQ